MKQSHRTFKHESLQDRKTIKKILKSIIRGVGKGVISFRDGDRQFEMKPQGLLHFKLAASQQRERNRLVIEISWQSKKRGLKKESILSISSK